MANPSKKSKSTDTNHRLYGAHLSVRGGLETSLVRAKALGVNAMQVHPSPPQRWNRSAYLPGKEDAFLALRAESGVEKVFFHAIYLINLATPNPDHAERSNRSLEYYLDLCKRIDGDGVVVHVGSLKDEADERVGYRRAAERIDEILDRTSQARLLLEVAAGAGAIIGDRLEELREIYDLVSAKDRVGFALDSQHLWASGYDLVGNLEDIVSQVEAVLGLERVHLFHLNDSLTALGSRRDRHANLGEGTIGSDALRRLIHHPKLTGIPFVLETPALRTDEGAATEVAALRALLDSALPRA